MATAGSSEQYSTVLLTCQELAPRPAALAPGGAAAAPHPTGRLLRRKAAMPLLLPGGGGRGQTMRGAAIQLDGLRPATRYNCTAQAATAAGRRSPPAAPRVVRTAAAPAPRREVGVFSASAGAGREAGPGSADPGDDAAARAAATSAAAAADAASSASGRGAGTEAAPGAGDEPQGVPA